jgi:hypothetical protein
MKWWDRPSNFCTRTRMVPTIPKPADNTSSIWVFLVFGCWLYMAFLVYLLLTNCKNA